MKGTSLAVHPRLGTRSHPLDDTRDTDDDEVGRYRLEVIALGVGDAVRFAGGLICDRSLAGWDVTVLVPTADDAGALRILGAVPVTELPAHTPDPQCALAISAAAIAADDAVRHRVLDTLAADATDVLVWDAAQPVTVPAAFTTVEHAVSAAARVFKGQALRALGMDSACGAAEVFSRTCGRAGAARGAAATVHRLGHGG
jgi:hypothetical protein